MRLRHSDEWVGLLVIIALLLFFGVAFEAGVLSRWFQSNATLRILLPEQGSAGLSPGADVEVLGTVRNFVCGRPVEHQTAIARVKRSPKMTAN